MEIFTEEELEYIISKLRINRCTPRELPNTPLYLIGLKGVNTILMQKDGDSIVLFSSRFPNRTNKFVANNLDIGIAYNISNEMVYKEDSDNPMLYTYWKNSTLKPLVRSDFNQLFEKFQSSTIENTLKTNVGWSSDYEIEDESGVYVLFYEHGFKIGISKSLKKRIKSYDKPWNVAPASIRIGIYDYHISKKIEKFIKKILKHFTTKGSTEFFYTSCVDESKDTLEAAFKSAHKLVLKELEWELV